MEPNPATRLLQRLNEGDERASQELYRLLYEELRRLARDALRPERGDHTLQPTALIHEAWFKLVDARAVRWNGRSHFFGVAARAMRQVLVDHARRRAAEKRGPGRERVPLDEALASFEGGAVDLLAVDEALERLARHDGELARLVELRFFGGLSLEEVAAALGRSPRQVELGWQTARAWLYRALGASDASDVR